MQDDHGGYQGFQRLNREQRRVLRAIEGLEFQKDFLERLHDGEVGVDGMEPDRVATVIEELVALGYVTWADDGDFYLSSAARCYRSEYLYNVVLRYAASVVGGSFGGLVVWVLSKLVG